MEPVGFGFDGGVACACAVGEGEGHCAFSLLAMMVGGGGLVSFGWQVWLGRSRWE